MIITLLQVVAVVVAVVEWVWHLLALLVVVDRLAEAVVVAGVELRPHEIVADITIIH